MLSKLAIRNVKRSIKDYLIFVLTTTLAFALMFSFNLIAYSEDISALSSYMPNFKIAVISISIIVCFVLGFLINYTIKFMFQKRSKEFGTYSLLGIEKKHINKLFLIENVILGLLSLVISFFIGFIFSQLISYLIMNVFNNPYRVTLPNNVIAPILLSCVYFLIIYVVALFLSYLRMRKMKIHDLLYLDKKNEKKMFKTNKFRGILFVISILFGAIGLYLVDYAFGHLDLQEIILLLIMTAILLLIISIYGLTCTLADFILSFVLKSKTFKYQKDHMFITRQFTTKIKTMSATLGTLALLITLTFVSLNVSNLFNGVFENQLDLMAPYDIQITDDEESIPTYLKIIEEDYHIKETFGYYEYNDTVQNVNDIIKDPYGSWTEKDTFIKLSDYNKLLELKDLDTITLSNDEFLLTSTKEYEPALKEIEKKIDVITLSNGMQLHLKEQITKNHSSAWAYGSGFILVITDEAAQNLKGSFYNFIVDTNEETKEDLQMKLEDASNEKFCEMTEEGYKMCTTAAHFSVRGYYEASNKTIMTILSFCLFYLSFIFTTVVGTILAIQALSDSNKYKYRYQTLSKLGVEEKNLYKIIGKQLLLFFLFPILYPLIISFVTTCSLNQLFSTFLTSEHAYLTIFFGGTALFLLVYLIYFIATYFGFKKNIKD